MALAPSGGLTDYRWEVVQGLKDSGRSSRQSNGASRPENTRRPLIAVGDSFVPIAPLDVVHGQIAVNSLTDGRKEIFRAERGK